MATHSSIFAWKIPWTEEPGRLHSPWGRKEWDTLSDFIFFLLLQDTESKIQRYTVGPCCFINCSVYLLIPNF